MSCLFSSSLNLWVIVRIVMNVMNEQRSSWYCFWKGVCNKLADGSQHPQFSATDDSTVLPPVARPSGFDAHR